MSRWLLAPVAVACLVAGLAPLGVASLAGARGVSLGLTDPALAPVLHNAALLAASICLPALALGLAGAFCLRRAGPAARALLFAIAVLVLVVPAPALESFPALYHPALRDLARLGCAVARGAALVLLVTGPSVHGLDPRLGQAARSAGATPLQAWRHTVLAPVWAPAVLGVGLAFLAALTQTRAAAILAPHLDLADAWVAPASLLLVACSAASLSVLMRRPA
jgi:ABC-type spermidine/putrescine transport system permease subunit II